MSENMKNRPKIGGIFRISSIFVLFFLGLWLFRFLIVRGALSAPLPGAIKIQLLALLEERTDFLEINTDLLGDSDSSVVYHASYNLSRGGTKAVSLLNKSLSSRNWHVRYSSLLTIQKMTFGQGSLMYDGALKLTEDEVMEVKLEALGTLVTLNYEDIRTRTALVRALREAGGNQKTIVKVLDLILLCENTPSEIASDIANFLDHPRGLIRLKAIESLRFTDTPSLIPMNKIRRMLKDSSLDVRISSAHLLLSHGKYSNEARGVLNEIAETSGFVASSRAKSVLSETDILVNVPKSR